MIGIVVVSHSRRLAEAAVELACQMVQGTQPAIEIAAGLDGGVLGTDAVGGRHGDPARRRARRGAGVDGPRERRAQRRTGRRARRRRPTPDRAVGGTDRRGSRCGGRLRGRRWHAGGGGRRGRQRGRDQGQAPRCRRTGECRRRAGPAESAAGRTRRGRAAQRPRSPRPAGSASRGDGPPFRCRGRRPRRHRRGTAGQRSEHQRPGHARGGRRTSHRGPSVGSPGP